MKELTEIQRSVLAFCQQQTGKGLPFPSLREIADQFGYQHTTARFHLKALEKKGYIKTRDQRVSDYLLVHAEEFMGTERGFELVSRIAAGVPTAAYEDAKELIEFDPAFFGGGNIKALTVSGESMTGDAISDGDIALIRLQSEANRNDILAVRVGGDEITLKRIRKKYQQMELIPSNPDFEVRSVPADQVEILGKLVGIIRKT